MNPAGPINIERKFEQLQEHWFPRVIAEMNDYQFKLVRLQGDFIWHDHPDSDETFIVIDTQYRQPGWRPNGSNRLLDIVRAFC